MKSSKDNNTQSAARIITVVLAVFLVVTAQTDTFGQARERTRPRDQDTSAPTTVKTDSARTADSVSSTDSLRATDSVRPQRTAVIDSVVTDSTRRTAHPFIAYTKADLRTTRYSSLSELLKRSPLAQPLSLGGFGQPNSVNIAGGFANDICASYAGHTYNDVWSGTYNMEQHSTEGYENILLFVGTDAVGRAPQSTLTWLDLQPIRHNTATPYSTLWYAQGGGDHIAGDITLSQNVAEHLNATVGVRRNGANGVFRRTAFDVWNIRFAATYTPSVYTSIDIRYDLASMNTDLWGGLVNNVSLTNVNEATAETVHSGLRDETRRHDGTVTFRTSFGPESTSSVSASAYFNSNNLLRIRDSTSQVISEPLGTTPFVVRTSTIGAIGRIDQLLGSILLRLGAGVDLVKSPAFDYADSADDVVTNFFGHAFVPLSEPLTMRFAARFGTVWERPLAGLGAALAWQAQGVRVEADVSMAQQASTLAEGRDLPFERHLLGLLTVHYGTLRAAAFHRRVSNVYNYRRLSESSGVRLLDVRVIDASASRTVSGVSGSFSVPIGDFLVVPSGRMQYDPSNDTYEGSGLRLMGELDVSYRHRVGKNWVRFGAVGIVQTPFTAETYVPTRWAYVHDPTENRISGNGLDLYLTAVLGNATVRASYENIFVQRWYTVPIYPEITQNLRVMLHWTFLD